MNVEYFDVHRSTMHLYQPSFVGNVPQANNKSPTCKHRYRETSYHIDVHKFLWFVARKKKINEENEMVK